MKLSDQLYRSLSISKTPQKIVSLVPSLTELLVELGLEDKLVGVTKFCVHPKHIRHEAQIIGGTKSVKHHKIEQLQPDFILANKEENTPEIVRDVAYFIWREPWMVVGHSNFINYMLQLCKMNNVYRDFSRYPEVDLSDMPQLDYVLLSSEPFPFKEQHFSEIPVKSEQIKIVDGECFSWYGSRLIAAFDYLLKLRKAL